MNVLVDTSVWSLAFRRDASAHPARHWLAHLISDGRASIIGPVRQELLSGVRNVGQYELLREKLRAFSDVEIQTRDYEKAATYFNDCRKRGVQGSNTDFLICAVASRRQFPILTTDKDFMLFSRHIPISLYTNSETEK